MGVIKCKLIPVTARKGYTSVILMRGSILLTTERNIIP